MFGLSMDEANSLANWVYIVAGAFAIASTTTALVASWIMWKTSSAISDEKDRQLAHFQSEAKEQTALLEAKTQELRGANLALELRVQPRRLSGENSAKLTEALFKMTPLPIGVVSRLLDPEGSDFADDISAAFTAARWGAVRQKDWTMSNKGVAIGVFDGTALPSELSDELLEALRAVNIEAKVTTIAKDQQNTTSAHFQPNALYLLVGAKP